MPRIKRITFIEDFEKPESCWDCPLLKTAQEKTYCALLGEVKGHIKKYESGFNREDCRLKTLAFERDDLE